MQYRSGTNNAEPLYDDRRSRAWVFIIRNASSTRLPEAFVPHTNFVSWAAHPGPSGWTLRGYCQWTNPRSYYILKSRYCKVAEWIPVSITDVRIIDEHVTRPIGLTSRRYTHGIQFGKGRPQETRPLDKVGLGMVVYDLTEEYQDVLLARAFDNEDHDVEEPDTSNLVTDDGVYWYDPDFNHVQELLREDREQEELDDLYHNFDTSTSSTVPQTTSVYGRKHKFFE